MKSILKTILEPLYYFFGNIWLRLLVNEKIFNLLFRKQKIKFKSLHREFKNQYVLNALKVLKQEGMVMLNFNELFQDLNFHDFKEYCLDAIEKELDHENGRKPYIDYYLSPKKLDHYPIIKKIFNDRNLNFIVSSYLFGMQHRLNYFRIWKNKISQEPERDSQIWHMDGDNLIV